MNEVFGSQELELFSFSSSSSSSICFFKASLAILFFSANFFPAATFLGSLILLFFAFAEDDSFSVISLDIFSWISVDVLLMLFLKKFQNSRNLLKSFKINSGIC